MYKPGELYWAELIDGVYTVIEIIPPIKDGVLEFKWISFQQDYENRIIKSWRVIGSRKYKSLVDSFVRLIEDNE